MNFQPQDHVHRIQEQILDDISSDLEKVVNRPQAENSEFYNVLKIA